MQSPLEKTKQKKKKKRKKIKTARAGKIKKKGLAFIISGTRNVKVQLPECICFVHFKPAVASITGTCSWI